MDYEKTFRDRGSGLVVSGSAYARVVAPTYLCRNPLMCAPDETSIALASMFDNAAAYDLCMLKKGYDEEK